MSKLTDTPAYRLHITRIPENAGTRRDCEKAATRSLIAEVFGDSITLAHTPEGAPMIEGHPEIRISLSHSKDFCILATGNRPNINIGVDIESARQQLLRVAPRFLTQTENRLAGETSDAQAKLELLLKLWTIKEAVYKSALTPGLSLTEISAAADFRSAQARGRSFSITLHSLPAGEQIAVATEEI